MHRIIITDIFNFSKLSPQVSVSAERLQPTKQVPLTKGAILLFMYCSEVAADNAAKTLIR